MRTASNGSLMTLGAQSQDACIVCGPNHPRGLRITYEQDSSGSSTASWIPTSEWEGFRGIVHGGIISTVLDEAMAKTADTLATEFEKGEEPNENCSTYK